MGRERKKGQKGSATRYIARTQAIKKLQLSLADFRRLCILKGIYPQEPNRKRTLNKGSTAPRTYYYVKDIAFLAHESLIDKYREFKVFIKRLKKAIGREEDHTVCHLLNNKPNYTLDHIIRERYPTFVDALCDLDDALSLLSLFSIMPSKSGVEFKVVHNCRRLLVEFMHFIVEKQCLRKVFLSIKGIYYQVELMGQRITWISPLQFSHHVPSDVDLRVMLTFAEFYQPMLEFVNFKLYNDCNIKYPPQFEGVPKSVERDPAEFLQQRSGYLDVAEDETREILASFSKYLLRRKNLGSKEEREDHYMMHLQDEETVITEGSKPVQASEEKVKNLFEGLVFYCSREVPKEVLSFVIRSCSGKVSWSEDSGLGSTYSESDDTITHQIVDRPNQKHVYLGRAYIQPQWVFDCINSQKLLPCCSYASGITLPPHLSPFVAEPSYSDYHERLKEDLQGLGKEREMIPEDLHKDELEGDKPKKKKIKKEHLKIGSVKQGYLIEDKDSLDHPQQLSTLNKMMLSKRKRRLYEQILYKKKKTSARKAKLNTRAASYTI